MSILLVILLLFVVVSAFIAYAAANVRSNVFVKSHSFAKTSQKLIALTFDDGPDATQTPLILNVLLQYQVKAAFFCIGENVAGNETLLKRMDYEGHLIGNHTFTHNPWIDSFPVKRLVKELEDTENKIFSVIGKRVHLFRPPFGVTNPLISKAVKKLGYQVVGWNIRSFDTMHRPRKQVVEKVKRKIKPGAVILLHDKCIDSHVVVRDVVEFAHANGYSFVRVDELLKLKGYV